MKEDPGLLLLAFFFLFKPSQGYESGVGFMFPTRFRIQDLKCRDLYFQVTS